MRLIMFNKPYGVLPQFTSADDRPTLARFVSLPGLYPAGRLDFDSEGLMLLTDFGPWQARISQPGSALVKRYRVQVEGAPTEAARAPPARGDAQRRCLPPRPRPRHRRACGPWPRDPPIRVRKVIPTAWIELVLSEGRNRQVRRMTAAVGFPTLRLIRWAVGPWTVDGLAPGQSREIPRTEAEAVLAAGRRELPRVRPNGPRSRSASRARGPARS